MTGSPAVLVSQYNITQQKELELKLFVSEAALQRCASPHSLPTRLSPDTV